MVLPDPRPRTKVIDLGLARLRKDAHLREYLPADRMAFVIRRSQ